MSGGVKALFVAAGVLALLFGGFVVFIALYDASNPVNTLDVGKVAIGGGIALAGLLAIVAAILKAAASRVKP